MFSRFCKADLAKLAATLTEHELRQLLSDWQLLARDDQLPPIAAQNGAPWRVWMILGGRGAGKTRAGAEWIRGKILGEWSGLPAKRIALVGETINDVRNVMIEGTSGLLAVHDDCARPLFEPSKMRLTWPNGAVAEMFSAESPERLRGPQFDAAWCDEVGKWQDADAAWDMLQFGLRLGEYPQVLVTTTPRSVDLLKSLLADEATVVSHVSTADNARNLAPNFFVEMERRYKGTALGRQELLGEFIDDEQGALWRRDWIEQARVASPPDLQRIVVAVDPPVTAKVTSDACGIVVAGLGEDGRAYVLADHTVQGLGPSEWARAVVRAYKVHNADRVVAEVNQGGDLMITVLRQVDPTLPVRMVRATRGKWVRAEPVAALYAEGRVGHVGLLEALEDQLCRFGADGRVSGKSPDRLDALVWAITDLMIETTQEPAVRMISG